MSDRVLTTITCFQIRDGPLVHSENGIEFDHDVFGWKSFSYAEHGNDLRIEAARDDRFVHGCVPSYAEWMVIRGMLLAGKACLRFTTLDDSDASPRPTATELSLTSDPGSIDKTDTVIPTTGHVILRVNAEVRNGLARMRPTRRGRRVGAGIRTHRRSTAPRLRARPRSRKLPSSRCPRAVVVVPGVSAAGALS